MKKQFLVTLLCSIILTGYGCPTLWQPQADTQADTPIVTPTTEKEPAEEGQDDGQPAGEYLTYTSEILEQRQASGQKVVLFFYASWCPFCQSADKAFIERSSEIPAGVTVLKTDYDSQTALKAKYGVNYQHTFVQIDQDGNQVAKWVSGDIDALNSNLK